MDLQLRPLQAPVGVLWVWLGVFDEQVTEDQLSWTHNGRAVVPAPVRVLSSVLETSGRGTSSGVYEFTVDAAHLGAHELAVEVRTGRTRTSMTLGTRPVPAQVPSGLQDSFKLLLVSCFNQRNDKGVGATVANHLTGADRPDVTLTVGDQVYLDNPVIERFAPGGHGLADRLEAKYRANWQDRARFGTQRVDGYSAILTAAPVAALPDDHEYWNNYPHAASFKPGTWFPGLQDRWATTARALYDGFQLARPDRYSYWFDVDPLSIFMMDNRTFRDNRDERTLSPEDEQLFEDWIRHVWDEHRLPVIVTGPSLLQPRKGWWASRIVDRNIANYGDYGHIMGHLLDFTRRGRSVLALTGDVHYGRVSEARLPDSSAPLHEVISSPSALVFGDPAGADTEPFDLPMPGRGSKLSCRVLWPEAGTTGHVGDHVALLRFRRTTFGARLFVSYYMIDPLPNLPNRHEVGPIDLHLRAP